MPRYEYNYGIRDQLLTDEVMTQKGLDAPLHQMRLELWMYPNIAWRFEYFGRTTIIHATIRLGLHGKQKLHNM